MYRSYRHSRCAKCMTAICSLALYYRLIANCKTIGRNRPIRGFTPERLTTRSIHIRDGPYRRTTGLRTKTSWLTCYTAQDVVSFVPNGKLGTEQSGEREPPVTRVSRSKSFGGGPVTLVVRRINPKPIRTPARKSVVSSMVNRHSIRQQHRVVFSTQK